MWVRRAGGAGLAVLAVPRYVAELKYITLRRGGVVGKTISPKWSVLDIRNLFCPKQPSVSSYPREGASHVCNLKSCSNLIKKNR